MNHKRVITRQQYLDALELIDRYHRQLSGIDAREWEKTPIKEWINNLDEAPSTRLHNLIIHFEYFEDVNKSEFFSIRNAGNTSWLEFCKLANIKYP